MKLRVTKQNIDIIEHTLLVSETVTDGSVPEYIAKYLFDEYWEQFPVVNAAFKKDGVPVYDTDVPPVIVDGMCRIPNAILTSGGTVEFGVFGTKANVNYPTVWSAPVIVETGCESGTEIPAPTQSEYQQIIQLVEASAASAASAQTSATTSASQAANAAQQAASSANSANASATSATSAASSANQSAQSALNAETAANDANTQATASASSAAASANSAQEASEQASAARASADNAASSADASAASANDAASYASEARDNADQAIAKANQAVQIANSKIGDAPSDNKQYGRKNGNWAEIEDTSGLPEGGGEGDIIVKNSSEYGDAKWTSAQLFYVGDGSSTEEIQVVEDVCVNGQSVVSHGIADITGVVTRSWVEAQGYYQIPDTGIPDTDLSEGVQESLALADSAVQSLDGYATEEWVEEQGYLTEHQSLDNYYTKSQVYSKTESDGKYLTEHQSLSAYRTSAAQDAIDAGKYTKPSGGIPSTDMSTAVQASLALADSALQEHQSLANYYTKTQADGKFLTEHQSLSAYRTSSAQDTIDNRKYEKPYTGIPKTDLASAVQTSLGKADSALQDTPNDNKVYFRKNGQWVERETEAFVFTLENGTTRTYYFVKG